MSGVNGQRVGLILPEHVQLMREHERREAEREAQNAAAGNYIGCSGCHGVLFGITDAGQVHCVNCNSEIEGARVVFAKMGEGRIDYAVEESADEGNEGSGS